MWSQGAALTEPPKSKCRSSNRSVYQNGLVGILRTRGEEAAGGNTARAHPLVERNHQQQEVRRGRRIRGLVLLRGRGRSGVEVRHRRVDLTHFRT
jgi:hypothetical protein